MYACMCHAVSDVTIRDAAAAGSNAEAIAAATGAGTSCGRCAETVAALVARARRCERTGGACVGCRGGHDARS